MAITTTTASEVLAFWFSAEVQPLWFQSTADFDAALTQKFLPVWQAATEGALVEWEATAEGALALVICMDQFPLNMFRGQPESFSSEAAARAVAERAIDRGLDQALNAAQKAFLYLPYMHSETLADQERGLVLFRAAGLDENLKFAEHHCDIVRRFGRFPHRNAILGRENSAQESAYLASDSAYHG